MQLILIRGISGSGKTTHAKELLKENHTLSHYEADMYFYKNGKYKFDPNKLNLAHHLCKTQTDSCWLGLNLEFKCLLSERKMIK
jgi:adenylate kinase family enzyme